jgi:hypothetical protein
LDSIKALERSWGETGVSRQVIERAAGIFALLHCGKARLKTLIMKVLHHF